MPKDTLVVEYAEFLKDIGLWYWNTSLIEILQTNFEVGMVNYSEKTMCKLIKLIAYNFQKNEGFLQMLEDALCLRIATSIKEKQKLGLDIEAMLNLTEGMAILSISRKSLNDLLKKVLLTKNAKQDNFINLSPRLLLQTVALLNDYEVQISPELKEILNVAIIES